jgi:alpha-beta hydrolase superfamily lysophospholipase
MMRHVITLFACLVIMLGAGCSTTGSDPWRSARLSEEFSLRGAAEVRSFDDYLALEERLFRELDEKVYAVTASGSGNELLRFSDGAAADPRAWRPNWNRSFELPAPDPQGGVLLLHGMSDSPYSLRALAEALNRAGYQVLGLRLPGHGTAPSGLKYIRWEDLAAAVRIGMAHLAARVGDRPLHIFGYSAGATLALDFTLEALDGRAGPVPASLVLISPAIGISRAAAFAGWKKRLSALPGMSERAWLVTEPEFDPYKYNSFATNAGQQMHLMTRSVAGRLSRLARGEGMRDFPPTLVFKSNADSTVTNASVVGGLLGLLEPDRHELVLFDVNRLAAASVLQVYDPRALTARVIGDPGLPFAVTLVTNEHADSLAVVARQQPPFSAEFRSTEPLGMSWPASVLSLSHVALPFPPDDPLYGQRRPDDPQTIFLGQLAIQGERGLFALSADWLLRLRHNPFYAYLETRAIDWATRHQGPRAEINPTVIQEIPR